MRTLAEAKAAAAAIAAIAQQYCAPDEGGSAGFPRFNAQVPIPPPAKADPPVLPAAALGSERSYNEQKDKGKEFEKGGKGKDGEKGGKGELGKGGQSDKGKGKEFEKGAKGEKGKEGKGKESQFPKATSHSTKCARISEEPPDVVEPNSNKMSDGAMTDGSKRRHEARDVRLWQWRWHWQLLLHLWHRGLTTALSELSHWIARHSQMGRQLARCWC